jgi:hypothetical protein
MAVLMDRFHHVERLMPLSFAKFLRTAWWRILPVRIRLALVHLWRSEQLRVEKAPAHDPHWGS